MTNTDLDVAAPEHVANVLRNAAEKFYDSSSDLESAWQDESSGRIWFQLAKVLERAADQCDARVAKY